MAAVSTSRRRSACGSDLPTTAEDRTSEIADLLAASLMRLQARKSSQISPDRGESSLDISPAESGHPARLGREKRE